MAAQYDTNGANANKLHRELLRWIQSLDLAYSIKNVKRDFSNGFLVAEIMSRYYDKDISMHSYDNAIGLKAKKDNWEQLHKVFTRISPDLDPLTSKTEIDAMIHCQNGAAVAFLTKLYQCLTKRTIPPAIVPSSSNGNHGLPAPLMGEIPPYAKPTGTALIRDKLRDPELAELNDESELNRRVRGIHAQHEESLQVDRLLAMETPDRYPTLRSATKATVLRGATKPVCNDETNPMVSTTQVIKEIHIKEMNLDKLRVTREGKEHENHMTTGTSVSVMRGGGGGSVTDLIQKRKPLDLLNEAVTHKLSSTQSSQLTLRGKDKFEAFLDAIHDGHMFATDQQAASVLTEILVGDDMCIVLAQAFLETPREFWKVTGLLFAFLTEHEEEHALFTSVHHGLVQWGVHCVERDASGAMVLLTDYILPRLPSILATHATKRAPLLQIMYAFVSESVLAHIQVIKRLRETMGHDIPLFIHLLSILLYMETQLDDTLIDLYYYYCGMGLETSCEKLRAASLSMLVPFLQYNITLVVDVLPRLTQFASRHAWWEVKTQLVLIASAFLHAVTTISEKDYTESIELALTIIEREFHPSGHLNVRRIGLSYLAKNLGQYQELVALYVDVLLSLPSDVRSFMLQENGGENVLAIRGTSGAHYSLQPLPSQWDSIAVAKQLYYEHKTEEAASFDVLQILEHCFQQLESVGAQDQICGLYEQMQRYLVSGLVDHNGCVPCSTIILISVRAGVVDVFDQEGMMEAFQAIVTRNVDDIRQETVVKLLQQVKRLSTKHSTMVQAFLVSLQEKCDTTTFEESLFS